MEVDEFAQLPWDVPETNAVDVGFVSLLKNDTKKENKSVFCIHISANKIQIRVSTVNFTVKVTRCL